jgi:hypothetical protein
MAEVVGLERRGGAEAVADEAHDGLEERAVLAAQRQIGDGRREHHPAHLGGAERSRLELEQQRHQRGEVAAQARHRRV